MESNTQASEKSPTKDVYAIVNERIINQLKKGTVPWRVPWNEAGPPVNLISKRPYRGINIMLLSSLGYEQNLFLTFKQIKDAGGKIIKDEKGHMVVYWNYIEIDLRDQMNEKKKLPYLRYYKVYNVAQCENLPEELFPTPTEEKEPIAVCEQIICGMPKQPVIQHKENSAWYNPVTDLVNVPKLKSFTSRESYYSTLFHELVHSTGHVSRLDRKDLLQMSELGSEAYSHEELVAEIGTCYLQTTAGITSEFEQSAAYINGWLEKLQNDKKFIFSASTHAQKAVDFMLNKKAEVKEDESEVVA